jgi:PTH1 family peptidyl-tRNA hydrolase
LGNPGSRYVGTRHNIGFEVVESIAGKSSWVSEKTFDYAKVTIRSRPVTLVKPTTFMNDSGLAVRDVMARSSGTLADLIVLIDDIHLDVGRIRVRRSGSEGGHNGLRSIVSSLSDNGFARVRLGVGKVPEGTSPIGHVLAPFEVAHTIIHKSADAVRTWCSDGIELSMNSFNNK